MQLSGSSIKFDLAWDDMRPRKRHPFKKVMRPYNQQQVDIVALLGGHDNQLGVAVRLSCGQL